MGFDRVKLLNFFKVLKYNCSVFRFITIGVLDSNYIFITDIDESISIKINFRLSAILGSSSIMAFSISRSYLKIKIIKIWFR